MDCQTLNYRRLDLTMITHTSYRLEDTQFSVHTSESVSKQRSLALELRIFFKKHTQTVNISSIVACTLTTFFEEGAGVSAQN